MKKFFIIIVLALLSCDLSNITSNTDNNITEINGKMTSDLYNIDKESYVINFNPINNIDSVYFGITMGRNSGYFNVVEEVDTILGIKFDWHFNEGYVNIKDTTCWLREWYYKIIFYKG